MERIIVNKIYKFLTAHSVLHRAQHGFVRGRSVCSNLLELLNDWTVYVQSRNQTTIIYHHHHHHHHHFSLLKADKTQLIQYTQHTPISNVNDNNVNNVNDNT